MRIQNAYESWKKNEISSQKMALIFFLYYHNKKYPSKQITNILIENDFNNINLEKLIFKKVKFKAKNALQKWQAKEWNFTLISHIPSPIEVLNYQAQGIRPVSIILQENFSPILTREDCFEFFLHDLEHGHMFFFDDQLKKMQMNFFQKILASYQNNVWTPYLRDIHFKQKFYYLISDMNSHREHYRQYLYSLIPKEKCAEFDFLFED